jgi:hypothetical protein
MKAGGRGDLATSHWKFYSPSPLRDSSLMLNLLQCHIVFFLIERLTQPQVSARIARKLGCRGALGGAPCL